MDCVTKPMTIGQLWVTMRRIDVDPAYQRESGVWSTDKKQLFLDSLLNGYDVPKIYFHDHSSAQTPILYSVIDGKQRLSAIWDFMSAKVDLANDFTFQQSGNSIADGTTPESGQSYQSFSEALKEYFRPISIDVVLVMNADEDDIEDLFSRLNNGEPLNAAEKRNAMGGDMTQLIRDTAKLPLFERKLRFTNRRYSHYEVAAKLIRLELTDIAGQGLFCDLKKKYLDAMVRQNRSMPRTHYDKLFARLKTNTSQFAKIFEDNDVLLDKQSYPQIYYVWYKSLVELYANSNLHILCREFLHRFHRLRTDNLAKVEEDRDPLLIEYGRLMQQGTNDINSMVERSRILTRYFLLDNPQVKLLDPRRVFTEEERHVIWLKSNRRCSICGQHLSSIDEMEADHVEAWSKGGETTLANAQALCISCNRSKGSTGSTVTPN